MASSREVKTELLELLEGLCEERLTADQFARLEHLVVKSRSARKLYLDYIHLHGTLLWDAAQSDGVILTNSNESSRARTRSVDSPHVSEESLAKQESVVSVGLGNASRWRGKKRSWSIALSAVVCLSLLTVLVWQWEDSTPTDAQLAEVPQNPSDQDPMYDVPREPAPYYRPFPIDRSIAADGTKETPVVAVIPPESDTLPLDMVAFVDQGLQDSWTVAGVTPSVVADDTEWLRRVYLDLVGQIPSASEVERFLADGSPGKRKRIIDQLLSSEGFDRHFATVWTNLLVGRSNPRIGNRNSLFQYLRNAFAENQPWDATVAAFISAEGSIDANPAANFLVAHLNNQAVPATAITARVFLSTQVQCMQCHNHPFNDWTQQDFWEMNSFFQQTKMVRNEEGKPTLVSESIGGPTLFETRNGLMKAAYPKYLERQIPDESSVNRRKEFARLIAEGKEPQLALAFVNRTWAQLLGAGFTNPIDDMGPHNPPSHPEILQTLSRGFVASGYDVKALVRWITSTKAYQLSSRVNETNGIDDPATGEMPLFSRAYTKPMTVEQVYDSLIVATRSEGTDSQLALRDKWVSQFVRTYETDENDESIHFQGSVPAALALMNGEVVKDSLDPQPGTTLHQALAAPGGDEVKLQSLAIATLNRRLAEQEVAAFRRLIRQQISAAPAPLRKRVAAEAYQDAFWALLNSGEFVTVP